MLLIFSISICYPTSSFYSSDDENTRMIPVRIFDTGTTELIFWRLEFFRRRMESTLELFHGVYILLMVPKSCEKTTWDV